MQFCGKEIELCGSIHPKHTPSDHSHRMASRSRPSSQCLAPSHWSGWLRRAFSLLSMSATTTTTAAAAQHRTFAQMRRTRATHSTAQHTAEERIYSTHTLVKTGRRSTVTTFANVSCSQTGNMSREQRERDRCVRGVCVCVRLLQLRYFEKIIRGGQ